MVKKIAAGLIDFGIRHSRLILLAGWIVFMYLHSLTPAELSSEESGRMLLWITGCLNHLGIQCGWLTEHILRKTAHFCEYSLFGILLIWNFQERWSRMRRRRETAVERFYPLALSVFAAPFLDETIQLFTPGRSAQISDVWLDVAGSCFGILIYCLAAKGMKRWKSRKRRRRWR